MAIDINKIYQAGNKTDTEVLTIFKGVVESDKFQNKLETTLLDDALQGKTHVCLRLEFRQDSNRSNNGWLTVSIRTIVLYEGEFGTAYVKSACNNDFMKFADILKNLFDESKMLYDVDEKSKFLPNASNRTGNNPCIEFDIKLREN